MKNKLRWKIPLMGFSRTPLPSEPEALWNEIGEAVEKENDGTALKEYFDDVERFAEGVFRDQRVDLSTKRRARCRQIVEEYEGPRLEEFEKHVDQLKEQFLKDPASIGQKWRDFFVEPGNVVNISIKLENYFGYKPLQRDQIDASLYCAAQVLLSVSSVRRWLPGGYSQVRITPSRLAMECMKVERWLQHLAYSMAYNHKHSGKAGRAARGIKQQERRELLKVRDIRKQITEADYEPLRREFGITQKTLKRDLDAIREKASP